MFTIFYLLEISARVCFLFIPCGRIATVKTPPFSSSVSLIVWERIFGQTSSADPTFRRHPSKQENGFVTKPIGLFIT